METLVANLINPQDKVIVVRNGVFGGRIADTVSRFGGEVISIDLEWGTVVTPEQIRKAFSRNS